MDRVKRTGGEDDFRMSVPLAIRYAAFEVRRRGHRAELVDKVIYQNPFQFRSQCARFGIARS